MSVSAFANNQLPVTARTDAVGFHLFFYSYLSLHFLNVFATTFSVSYECSCEPFSHLQNLVVAEQNAFMLVNHSAKLAQVYNMANCRTTHSCTSCENNNWNCFVLCDAENVAYCANMRGVLP